MATGTPGTGLPGNHARRRLRAWSLTIVALSALCIAGDPAAARTAHPDTPPLPHPSAAEASWRALAEAAFATEITVDPSLFASADYADLNAALDAAPLGAVIRLKPGLYRGPFLVERPVTLIGDGAPERVIIEAEDRDTLRWIATGGRIAGLTVRTRRSDASSRAPFGAIDIAAGAVVIEDVIVASDAGPAVHVRDDARATIRRLTAAPGGATAISAYRGGVARVIDPTIGGHRGAAIEVFAEARVDLTGGVIAGGQGGVFAIDGAQIEIRDTLFDRINGAAVAVASGSVARLRGVTVEAPQDAGFLIGADSMLAAIDCRIRGAKLAGVEARDGARVSLRRCVIENADQGGVLARAGATLRIERSVVRGSRLAGVEVRNGASAALAHNRIHDGGASGVYVHGDASATLSDNEISDNARAGIEVASGGRARLSANALVENRTEAVLVRDGGQTENVASNTADAGLRDGAEPAR